MAKQHVAFELFYDNAWRDITADEDVFTDNPIVIMRGQGDESPAPRPARITATLANDDDRYRTSNPESPLYGKAGRNTPTRVAVAGSVRGRVEASSWVCGQTRDFRVWPRRGKAWTEFEGGGLLQRIGQWTESLKSPFRQYNETITQAIGYFHAEQDRGATELVSTVAGSSTSSGPNFGFAFDSQHRPPGSAPLMDVSDGAQLGYYFNRDAASATSTAGWQLSWAARHEPLIPGEQTIMYWNTADGTAYGLYLDATTGQMLIYSSKNGTPVLAYGESYNGYDFGQWTMFNVGTFYSGGTTSIWAEWTNADNTQSDIIGTSFVDVTSSLTRWSVLGGDGEIPPGSTIGHIIGANVDLFTMDLFSTARIDAWTGHLGELAAVRFARLCDLKGIPYYVSNGWAGSSPMGPQPVDTLANQFKEIATTEDGLIYDHRTDPRLYLLCRPDRYNQTPALELTPEDLPALPREVTDDLPVHNIVTVAQRDGNEVTAEDSTGPLGTQAPPDGVGEYRQTVDVNIDDERDLSNLANWWLRRGTVNLPRYPQVTVNLAALSPSKVAEVEAVDVGSVITITGFREYVIRLHVLGYTEVIGTHSHQITFVCAPDQQFHIGTYGVGSTVRLYDSGTTTVKTDVTRTGTTVVFRTTDENNLWSTTSLPYDVMIAGQRSRVTAMGAASLVSGAYDQTATVVRGIDGIRKELVAGDPIRIATPGRYAL